MHPERLLSVAFAMALFLAGPARAERTELAVDRDATLLLNLNSGTLIVQTWDRDVVQIEARGEEDLRVDLRKRGRRAVGTISGAHGHPVEVDIDVRIPEWMPLEIEGRELECELELADNPVEARVLGGDLLIQGGRERVKVRSVHGSVTLRGTRGDIDVHATNEDIRMHDVEGDLLAESVNGDIRIEGAIATRAELVTTTGDILYDGSIQEDGDYFLGTHDGDVRLSIPPNTNALIEIETYDGEVHARGAELEQALVEVRRGREYRAELGQGQGRVRIRNFAGEVELYDLKSGHRKRG